MCVDGLCEREKLETANQFRVVRQGNRITILGNDLLAGSITLDQAANLAAWLVVLADPECLTFEWTLAEIQK